MQSLIVDSHAHLCDYSRIEIKKGWLPVTVGYSHSSNLKNLEIAKKYNIPIVMGIAPQTVVREDTKNIDEWLELITNSSPNAIGEIGLDFYWAKTLPQKEEQLKLFKKLLDIAEKKNLPVVIHSRDSFFQIIEILKEYSFNGKILFHFFSGKKEEREKALEFDSLLSFPPIFSKEREESLKSLDLENILVESDSPYIVRDFYQVEKVIDWISKVKHVDREEVIRVTFKNALKFFNFTQKYL